MTLVLKPFLDEFQKIEQSFFETSENPDKQKNDLLENSSFDDTDIAFLLPSAIQSLKFSLKFNIDAHNILKGLRLKIGALHHQRADDIRKNADATLTQVDQVLYDLAERYGYTPSQSTKVPYDSISAKASKDMEKLSGKADYFNSSAHENSGKIAAYRGILHRLVVLEKIVKHYSEVFTPSKLKQLTYDNK